MFRTLEANSVDKNPQLTTRGGTRVEVVSVGDRDAEKFPAIAQP